MMDESYVDEVWQSDESVEGEIADEMDESVEPAEESTLAESVNTAAKVKTEPAEAVKTDAAEPPKENRNHLISSVPKAARAPMGALTKQQMRELRDLFSNMDDVQIQRLYKKVTKNN